jgi:hypothetical protein
MSGMFVLEINTDNDAFAEDEGIHEVARLLANISDRIKSWDSSGWILDANGNTVGSYGWVDRP